MGFAGHNRAGPHRRVLRVSNSVADKVRYVFDRSCQITDFTRSQAVNFHLLRSQHAKLQNFESFSLAMNGSIPKVDRSVFDSEVDNDATITVVKNCRRLRRARLVNVLAGGGIQLTIASRTSVMPILFLALANTAVYDTSPITSSISCLSVQDQHWADRFY